MNKKDHIKYWKESAAKDLEVMNYLMKGGKYVHALFFGHLYLEKLCKALWVANNTENIAPKWHNLLKLLKEANVDLDESQQVFLLKLNQYQIEGRYPEDIKKLYKLTTKALANEYIKEIKSLKKCFLGKMR
ncbi:MAG TPA: HEPN domain-containing protein [Bacteroidia bacterium]|nr:HEPN domain-containing protein [Bacteroidia bacterium]